MDNRTYVGLGDGSGDVNGDDKGVRLAASST
jgi:hypothetical protein